MKKIELWKRVNQIHCLNCDQRMGLVAYGLREGDITREADVDKLIEQIVCCMKPLLEGEVSTFDLPFPDDPAFSEDTFVSKEQGYRYTVDDELFFLLGITN